MSQYIEFEDGIEAVPPAWVKPVERYGVIEGFDENDYASPKELERIYYEQLWGPVLMLPEQKKSDNAAWKCYGDLDYNAFASVDFDRMRPEFNKIKYKADKLQERLKDLMIMIRIKLESIDDNRKYKVLRLVGKGHLEPDDIRHGDMWQLGLLYRRAVNIKKEIGRLREASFKRKQQAKQK
jgi:hypothetical protein